MPDMNQSEQEPREKRQFIREKIARPPMTRKQLAGRMAALSFIAVLGGAAAGAGFAVARPLAEKYLEAASAMNISPEAFHRVATVASGGLDSLPHCGAVITLLAVCKLTHKDSYTDIGVVTCVIPIAAVIVIVALGSIGIV